MEMSEHKASRSLRGSLQNSLDFAPVMDNTDFQNEEQTPIMDMDMEIRRLEEVAYWRKRAGWYDDADGGDDDFVPSGVSSSGGSSSSGGGSGSIGDYAIAFKIVGGFVAFIVMVFLAKQFSNLGRSSSKKSSKDRGSDNKEGRSSSRPSSRSNSRSASRTRSKSRSRSLTKEVSRARSRSRSRARGDVKRSRSRSRSKKASEDYNLMEDDGKSKSSSSRNSRRGLSSTPERQGKFMV